MNGLTIRRLAAGIALVVVLATLAVAYGVVMSRSRTILEARYPLPPGAVVASTSPDAIARGARLVTVLACTGCHGMDLTGGPLYVAGTQFFTPNLTLAAKRRSDAELDRALRHGLRPDGTSELVMPAQAYAGLTDDEVAAIIGWLRSLPAKGAPAPKPVPGLILRASLALGRLKPAAEQVATARPPIDAGPGLAGGRRLAAVACGRCHGTDLGGIPNVGSDLTVRGYYGPSQFHALMRKGDAVGEGEMKLMIETAQASFSHFTDAEIDQIYAYLLARDRLLAARAPKIR